MGCPKVPSHEENKFKHQAPDMHTLVFSQLVMVDGPTPIYFRIFLSRGVTTCATQRLNNKNLSPNHPNLYMAMKLQWLILAKGSSLPDETGAPDERGPKG